MFIICLRGSMPVFQTSCNSIKFKIVEFIKNRLKYCIIFEDILYTFLDLNIENEV